MNNFKASIITWITSSYFFVPPNFLCEIFPRLFISIKMEPYWIKPKIVFFAFSQRKRYFLFKLIHVKLYMASSICSLTESLSSYKTAFIPPVLVQFVNKLAYFLKQPIHYCHSLFYFRALDSPAPPEPIIKTSTIN